MVADDVRDRAAGGRGARVDETHALGHQTAQLANEFGEPYQVQDSNFGWSARDACYSYGSFVLEDDEAWWSPIAHRYPDSGTWWCGTSSWAVTS